MTKKMSLIIAFVLILGVASILFYTNQYSIADEEQTIYTNLIEWQNRGSDFDFQLTILDIVQIDQSRSSIVLFETSGNNIGYAHLIKGWNGKYKIVGSGWGDSLVSYTDIKTSNGVYGILIGKNTDLKIHAITAVTVDGLHEFSSIVADADTFIRYEKLPRNLKQTFVSELVFFDKDGQILDPFFKET